VLGLAVAVQQAVVQPLEPVDGVLASITPTFRWTVTDTLALPRPIAYRLRIARDSALQRLLVDTMLTDTARYDLLRPVKPGYALRWRVDAMAATGMRDSTRLTGPVTVPRWATPTTLNDPAGATTDDPRPTFAWVSPPVATPPGPLSYEVLVYRASTGALVLNIPDLPTTSAQSPVPLETNVAYRWAVVTRAGLDTSVDRSVGVFVVLDATLPRTTLLFQNFPNPFPAAGRDATCLWFDLATTGPVALVILDLRGNLVRRLIPGPDFAALLPAGRYGRGAAGGPVCDARLSWDGTTADGRIVPPGVYLTKLTASGANFFRRIVFRGGAR